MYNGNHHGNGFAPRGSMDFVTQFIDGGLQGNHNSFLIDARRRSSAATVIYNPQDNAGQRYTAPTSSVPHSLRAEHSLASVTSSYSEFEGEDAEKWPTSPRSFCPSYLKQLEEQEELEDLLSPDFGSLRGPPPSREMTPSVGSASTYDGSDEEEIEVEAREFDDAASSISRASARYRSPSVAPTQRYAHATTVPPTPHSSPARAPISATVSAASASGSPGRLDGRPRRAYHPSVRKLEHDDYVASTSPKKHHAPYSLSAGGTSRRK